MRTSVDCGSAAPAPSALAATVTSRARLKRFDDDKDDDRQQQHGGNFIDPAVKNVAMTIAVVLEVEHQFAAIQVIKNKNNNQRNLRVQPAATKSEAQPKPGAGHQRQDAARR